MAMFSFDHPVKMKAADQGGISAVSGIETANLGNYLRKSDENFIRTFEKKEEGGIENADWEKKKYKRLKDKYGDEFSSSIKSDTRVANLSKSDIEQEKNELNCILL